MNRESGLGSPVITEAVNAKVEAESLITKERVILWESLKELDTYPRAWQNLVLTAQPGPYPYVVLYGP